MYRKRISVNGLIGGSKLVRLDLLSSKEELRFRREVFEVLTVVMLLILCIVYTNQITYDLSRK